MMMETNSTTGLKTTGTISIINFETLFDIVETDFSEWKFYDDSLYESAFNLTSEVGASSIRYQENLN